MCPGTSSRFFDIEQNYLFMIKGETYFQQVNWTPYFFEDLVALRDTWLVLTILLSCLLTALLLLLVFLRRRICLAIALIEQGSRAVSQVRPLTSFSSKNCHLKYQDKTHHFRFPPPSSSHSSRSFFNCWSSPGSSWSPCTSPPQETRSTG